MDGIVTRNPTDYQNSDVQIWLPEQALEVLSMCTVTASPSLSTGLLGVPLLVSPPKISTGSIRRTITAASSFSGLSRCQSQTSRRAVGPAHGGDFGDGGDGLAGLDGAVYGVGGACGLIQAAFFVVVQVETPRLWINSMVEW